MDDDFFWPLMPFAVAETHEEIYQRFKERLLRELLVDLPNASHYGRLIDEEELNARGVEND